MAVFIDMAMLSVGAVRTSELGEYSSNLHMSQKAWSESLDLILKAAGIDKRDMARTSHYFNESRKFSRPDGDENAHEFEEHMLAVAINGYVPVEGGKAYSVETGAVFKKISISPDFWENNSGIFFKCLSLTNKQTGELLRDPALITVDFGEGRTYQTTIDVGEALISNRFWWVRDEIGDVLPLRVNTFDELKSALQILENKTSMFTFLKEKGVKVTLKKFNGICVKFDWRKDFVIRLAEPFLQTWPKLDNVVQFDRINTWPVLATRSGGNGRPPCWHVAAGMS